ncbi:hypothetical protein [Alistipes sp.]|uniref:hypothetical protein n=1 Tax=Alistipes sp. TaxID=1872444 RepID=UPI003AF13982
MAENATTRVVQVEVNTTDAIKVMAEYEVKLQEAKRAEQELKTAIKERGGASQEDREQLAVLREQQKAYSSQIRELSREVQNNIKTEQLYKNTLKGLGAELSSAKDKLRGMQLGTAEYAKQEKVVAALNERMKQAEQAYGVFSRDVGNYEKAAKGLRTQIRELTEQLVALKMAGQENSEQYRNLSARAAELNDAMSDVNQQTRGLASDTANLDFGRQAAEAAIGAFGLLNSMMGASMEDNDKYTQTMKNMQVAMTALASLTALKNATEKQSILMQKISLAQTQAGTLATKLATAAESKNIIVRKAATIAQAALNAVMNANPVMLLVTGVGLLVARLYALSGSSSKSKHQLAEFNREAEKTDRILKQTTEDHDFEVRLAEAAGKSGRELLEIRRENAKKELAVLEKSFEEQSARYNAANKKTRKKMQEAYDKLIADRQAAWDKLDAINDDISVEEVKSVTEAEKKKAEIRKEYAEKRAQALKTELADIRAALDAEIALMADGAAKDLATENERHNRKIEDLRKRLDTEKNLTESSRAAINRMIEAEELQHELNVAKLEAAADLDRINREEQTIALRLAAVKKGTDEEFSLKMEQLQKQQEAELANAELTEQQKALIAEKYNAERETLAAEQRQLRIDRQSEEIVREFEIRIGLMQKFGADELSILQEQVAQKQAILDNIHQVEGESEADYAARRLAAKADVAAEETALSEAVATKEVEIEQTKQAALSNLKKSAMDLLDELGESNKAFAIMSKTITLAEIAVNTGKAIAAGTAQAMAVPFPANIAAIATTVAAIMANITSAIKTVKSAKFAAGGYVDGPGTATSDSIPAMLSNGESVNAASSTSLFAPIYSALNQLGGGAPIVATQSSNQIAGEEMLARAFAKGVSQLDMRVGVDEIARVSDRVKVVESLGDL